MNRDRLLLLTTVGRKTGQPRTTSMMFHRDGTRLLVIASNVGAPRHPDWYVNLVATPRVAWRSTTRPTVVATPVEAEELARLWTTLKRTYPFFADHDAKTDRTIPVVVLTRA